MQYVQRKCNIVLFSLHIIIALYCNNLPIYFCFGTLYVI